MSARNRRDDARLGAVEAELVEDSLQRQAARSTGHDHNRQQDERGRLFFVSGSCGRKRLLFGQLAGARGLRAPNGQ